MNHVYQNWMSRGGPCDTMYYTDGINGSIIDSAISYIKSKRTFPISEHYKQKDAQPLVIAPAEQTFIVRELRKSGSLKWPAGMFLHSRVITVGDTAAVFKITRRYPQLKADKCSVIYTFSKPIYIRNETICFYLQQEQTSAGTTLMYRFYSKVKAGWAEYVAEQTDMGNKSTTGDPEKSEASSQGLNKEPPILNLLLDNYSKAVLAAFKTNRKEAFLHLYPTLDQQIADAKSKGHLDNNISPVELNYFKYEYQLSSDAYNKSCAKVIKDAAKLNFSWSKATFINSTIQQDDKGNFKISVRLSESGRTFNLVIWAMTLYDNSLKTIFYASLEAA